MTDTNTAQLVVDLQATDNAVRAKGWVAPGLGVPGAPLGLLGSTLNPLSGLAAAGLAWFMPLVSFLGDGLTQLQGGNGASVTSGSQDFGTAGQDITGVANSYRDLTSAQTANWSGAAASEYREAGARHADGVAGLGQASTMTGSAIIGAGQVVAQAIAEVTELIAEAVSEIVPIMTQAVARAGETFGQSVVEAIPPCVGIAVTYALRIAAKLAALVASGDNLLKLVQGGMAVVELIQQALSSISGQSIRADAQPQAGAGQHGGGPASTMGGTESGNTLGAADSGTSLGAGNSGTSLGAGNSGTSLGAGNSGNTGSLASGSSAPVSSASGTGGGAFTPSGSAAPLNVATQSSGAIPPPHGTVPDASRTPGPAGGSGVPIATAPSGGVPIGAAALAPGARADAGHGAGTVRQEGRQQPARTSGGGGGGVPGGAPLGAIGGVRPAGATDKEHQRKYSVVEQHEEILESAPPVIGSGKARN